MEVRSFEDIDRHVGLVLSYWKKYGYNAESYHDKLQDAYLVIVTAMAEHDPAKGGLSTCISKVARRFQMRNKRYNSKKRGQTCAELVKIYERLKDSGVDMDYPHDAAQYLNDNATP